MAAADGFRHIIINHWSAKLNVALSELTFEYTSHLLKDLCKLERGYVLAE